MNRKRPTWFTVPKSNNWGCAFAMLGLIVATSLMAWIGIRSALEIPEAMQSSRWPIVQGRTTSVSFASSKADKNRSISYAFEVGGVRYSGNRHKCVEISRAPYSAELRAIHRTFATGATVSVAYDPTDPSRNVLSPGTHWTDFAQVGVLLFFPAATALLICMSIVGVAIEKLAKRRTSPT